MSANNERINANNKSIILPNLGYWINKALFAVHNGLGYSLLEKYYGRALEKEFDKLGLKYRKQVAVPLEYRGEKIGKYIIDFIVEDLIVLEIKARNEMPSRFYKQALAYLKHLNLPLSILVNFRRPKLSPKRIVNPNYNKSSLGEVDKKFA